jgi:sucrose-6-phosphatase
MRLLLCTDMDRTLLPNGPQPESPGARRLFSALTTDSRVRLAYVTGRSLPLAEEAIAEYEVPVPDMLVADVGTAIFAREQGTWRRDTAWEELIGQDWRQLDSAALARLLTGLPGLRLQEEGRQARFKLSYYVEPTACREPLAAALAAIFQQRAIRVSLIWSHDEITGADLLDILPASADKYLAVQFLRRRMGFSVDEVLFAGDSGNDLAVLASEIPAVLVANARQDVAEKAAAMAMAAGNADKLHLAGGWLGMNGCYSAGILEGVARYQPAFFQDGISA